MKSLTTANVIHVMDKDKIPAITIAPGDLVAVETAKPGIPNEVFEKDYTKEAFPKRILTITGPIYVIDSEPGDLLKIEIQDIQLDNIGKMWMGQWMGILMDEVDHCYMKNVKLENDKIHFDDNLFLQIKPMIGTIGVAPFDEPVDCLVPGRYGGNMDAPCVAPGNTLYLPVQVKGGLLCLGDVHAAMGLGEIFGTGVEIGSTVILKIDVIKGKNITWPLVEKKEGYEIVVSEINLDEACKEAVRTAIQFVMEHTHFKFDEAYALVGQVCNLKIVQVVNPKSTVSMEVPKYILNKQFLDN